MASTSSQPLPVSIHPPPHWSYDVFLSFRGQDTRNSFTAHLYSALVQRGINAYKDDKELERGKTIEPELWKAIRESMFSIIIFSNDYASSPWCLDELVEIVHCMKTRGQIVLPIFYDVDPSDVADQTGSYKKAFVEYEETFKDNKAKVKMWKDTLSDAANLSGWDVRHRDQSEIIKEIVDRVWYDVSSIALINDKRLVGMDFHIMKMKHLLGEDQLMDVQLIGICGMGGIGKTTIAEVVYDRIRWQFEVCCFLANVKEAFKIHGVGFLQEQMLSKITRRQNTKVWDAKSGAFEIRRSLRNKKVLIIFDDVDELEQLETLTGERDWFGPGSRVIITSRDRHLLSTHGVDGIYDVKVLNDHDALMLLSRKAFKQDQPPEDYLDLSKLVLAHVEGLPLALSVLGSFLYGRSLTVWRNAIDRLHKLPHRKIIDVLQISFDGLEDSEKQIFLDIASCFKGEDKEWVTAALDACGFHAYIGMQVLIEKSLVSISEDDVIEMHELLQVMGRNIIKQEEAHNDLGRSRLWDLDDIRQAFGDMTENKAVEIIFLNGIDWHLNLEVFSKMNKLRILKLGQVLASGGRLTHLSNELGYLDWDNYPFKSLPSSFQPNKLVELHLNYSDKIERLWYGCKVLNCLKSLNLSWCINLVETPDFTGTPNLEKLCLFSCTKLSRLHPSFQNLKRLIEVDLRCCINLEELPTSIETESLQILNLANCWKLNKFPTIRGVMPRLCRLCLNKTDLRTLPDSIQNLVGLVSFELQRCTSLESIPSCIGHLKMLEKLDLFGCSNLNELPEDLCQLTSLKSLELRSTGIRQLPRSIFFLKNLKEIHFGGRQFSDSPSTTLPSLSSMVSLERLELSYCNIVEGSIPEDIGCLPKLAYLNLTGNSFVSLPQSVIQLDKLLELILEDCRMLRALPKIPPNVYFLSTNGCIALEEMPDPVMLQNPESSVFQCFNCMKLYENNGGDHFASKMIQRYLKGSSIPRSRFNIIVPVRKIPRWFTHQTEGRLITILTPTDILCDSSSEWVGFAACVLFKIRKNNPHYVDGLTIRCCIYCTVNNNEVELDDSLACIVKSLHMIGESAHCWSFFVSLNPFKKLKIKSTSDLHLSFHPRFEHAKIKRCGVRLVSFQDIQELKTDGDISSCEDCDIDGLQDDIEESSVESELGSHYYYPRRLGFFERMVYFFRGKIVDCLNCSIFRNSN